MSESTVDAYSDSEMDLLMNEVAKKKKLEDESENRSDKNALNRRKSVNRQQAYYDELSSASVTQSGKSSELSMHEPKT